MVFIFTSSNDNSTNSVLDWIHCLGFPFIRTKSYQKLEEYNDTVLQVIASGVSIEISGNPIRSVWFRKYSNIAVRTDSPNASVSKHLQNELLHFNQSLFAAALHSTKVLGTNNCIKDFLNLNKFNVLILASKLGFDVPETIITTSKALLTSFKKQHKSIIVKSLSDPIFFREKKGKKSLGLYTAKISTALLASLPLYFFPSMVQKYCDKLFELRVFVLHDALYSAAIFSQLERKTKIDFRIYDEHNPTRYVPFELPTEVRLKILKLFGALGLNTGSVDMIVTQKYKYIFLEINPVGQFEMISIPCNFHIEKKIAEYLTE